MLFRNTKYQKIVKLIKIVDLEESEEFNFKQVLLNFLEQFVKFCNSDDLHFEINYGNRSWKTIRGFKKGIKWFDDNNIVHFTCSNGVYTLSMDNPLMNLYKNLPSFNSIQVSLSIPSEEFNYENWFQLIQDQLVVFQFDYGYVRELSTNYVMSSESKIKRSLFGGLSLKTKESESAWNSHIYGIKLGYLKDIYEVNFLNNSQMKNPFIVSFFDQSLGNFQKFGSNLHIWTLTPEQVAQAKDIMQASQYLIGSDIGYKTFLTSIEADEIKKKTFIDLGFNL